MPPRSRPSRSKNGSACSSTASSPSGTRDSSPTGCAAPGSSIKPASRTSTSDTRRGLDRQIVLGLADGRWVREHLNVLISGPTGIGKSWLACAFAHSACRNGHSALYVRVSRLLSELVTARADGRYPRRLESLAKTEVLVMDDWGLTPFSAENRLDLLEVLEDRHGVRSTVVTSQLPVDKWHDVVGDPTLGDAILDRLVHNAYKLDLKGDSMRKRRRPSTRTGNQDP